jgi:hypothetical protein
VDQRASNDSNLAIHRKDAKGARKEFSNIRLLSPTARSHEHGIHILNGYPAGRMTFFINFILCVLCVFAVKTAASYCPFNNKHDDNL